MRKLGIFTLFLATAVTGFAQKTAKDLYLDKCAVCHGPDGAAKTAKGKKSKTKDVRETIKTDSLDQMIKIATEGKKPNMDGFGKEFPKEQLKAMVEYYRSLAK